MVKHILLDEFFKGEYLTSKRDRQVLFHCVNLKTNWDITFNAFDCKCSSMWIYLKTFL